MPYWLEPSEVVHGWLEALIGTILFWFYYWFTCCSFSGYDSSIVTLVVTAGEVAFTNILQGISMITCVNLLV